MSLNHIGQRKKIRCASVWDLDGTLLRTDVFAESVVRLSLRKPWLVLAVIWWLRKGRGYCKGRVAMLAAPMWTTWPVREAVRDRIASDCAAGEPVLLATAAHHLVAEKVAAAVGLFDGVIASTDTHNLKGTAKLEAIRRWTADQACDGYSYAGDSAADLPIWSEANHIIAVAPSVWLRRRLVMLGKPLEVVDEMVSPLTSIVRALRPHQWVKNVLVFVPMIVGQRLAVANLVQSSIGFIVFCLTASAVYVLNDLSDLDADRLHHKKQTRPFASGELSVHAGVGMVAILLACALCVALVALPPVFLMVMAGYFVANVAYSAFLKKRPIFDVLMLATMYVVRLEAGGAATGIPLSPWLLAFSLFFFTSLAFAKRYAELQRIAAHGGLGAAGRGYKVVDCETILSLGTASGYVAIMVLALYMNSDQMRALYGDSRLLWLICPFVMYWITRVWLLARRGVMDEDPVVFAFHDRASLAVAGVCAALLAAATLIEKRMLLFP